MSMRLFYAVTIPQTVKARIGQIQSALRRQAVTGRWVETQNLHLTLAFLGEQPESQLPALEQILKATADTCSRFSLTISGWGTFGRRADILWLGIEKEIILIKAEETLRQQLIQSGFTTDTRPYLPHLTICRDLALPPGLALSYQPLTFAADRLVLMASYLESGRRVYREHSSFALNGMGEK